MNGNVCITGTTNSTSNIATTGAYQTSLGGSHDAFVAKFNSAGVMQWATYYGGTGNDPVPCSGYALWSPDAPVASHRMGLPS